MKASELITKLQEMHILYGDLETFFEDSEGIADINDVKFKQTVTPSFKNLLTGEMLQSKTINFFLVV